MSAGLVRDLKTVPSENCTPELGGLAGAAPGNLE